MDDLFLNIFVNGTIISALSGQMRKYIIFLERRTKVV